MNTVRTNKLLTVVIVLQGLLLLGQWTGSGNSGPSMLSTASAQVPDAGAQRLQILDELRTLNSKMDRLDSFVESGRLQVTVTNDDKKAARSR